MRIFSFSPDNLTHLANQLKEAISDHMASEGLITSEQAETYKHQTIVTIAERATLFPWFKTREKDGILDIFVSKLPYEEKDEIKDEKS